MMANRHTGWPPKQAQEWGLTESRPNRRLRASQFWCFWSDAEMPPKAHRFDFTASDNFSRS
jgi:hypothetical protein